MRNHPLELVEHNSSILVIDYDVRQDSGGPGKFRYLLYKDVNRHMKLGR